MLNHKKDGNKKNRLHINSRNKVESIMDMDENVFCTYVEKDANLSSLHDQEEKELTKIFHINIHVNKTTINALFDSG
jgi:hypothetical protein